MKKLEKWWVQLEERTKYLLDVLLAPSSSVAHTVAHPAAIPKNEKKTREKKKKNLEFLTGLGREKGLELYALMEDVLKERNEKRMLWKERVKSKVFDRLPAGCRPLTGVTESPAGGLGVQCSCNHLTEFAVLELQGRTGKTCALSPSGAFLFFGVVFGVLSLCCLFALCLLVRYMKGGKSSSDRKGPMIIMGKISGLWAFRLPAC